MRDNDLQPELPGLDKRSDRRAMDSLKFDKTFRIAVTGDVRLTEVERLIVDTAAFQRLRGVRQLGPVVLVYPSALHTRFEHSLGTLAMADRMVMSIAQGSDAPEESQVTMDHRLLARLYGLLHDITHIPFGHTIEDELGIYPRHDENPTRIYRFLGPETDIGKVIIGRLGQRMYDRFMSIYLWEPDEEEVRRRRQDEKWKPLLSRLEMEQGDLFIHDIVSNTVCADLLDYLARDDHFCNLAISLEYRFLNYLYLHVPEQSKDERQRVFVRLWKGDYTPRRDILTDLTRLLEARYMLAERAYFHHTKLVAGAMLGRAIQEYKAGLDDPTSEDYLYQHSDDTLVAMLTESRGTVGSELARRLRTRRLYKVIERFDRTAFDQAQEANHDTTFREDALTRLKDPMERKDIEDAIAVEAGAEPGDVLVYAPPYNMNMKVARVNVRWKGKDTELRSIDDPVIGPRLSEILKAHQMLWSIWIFGKPELDEEQRALTVEAFKLRFLLSTEKKELRERKYFEEIIRREMTAREVVFPYAADLLQLRLREEASDMLKTAKDPRDFRQRVNGAVDRVCRPLE